MSDSAHGIVLSMIPTPSLAEAFEQAREDIVAPWLSAGGSSCEPLEPEGLTPLGLVARRCANGAAGLVERLLSYGARAHTDDAGRGNTALHWAVSGFRSESPNVEPERVAVLQRLLKACEQAGQPWPVNAFGWGVLHSAAAQGADAMVALLLSLGANVKATDSSGDTALHVAYRQQQLVVAQILNQAWVGDPPRNHKRQTPLDVLKAKKPGAQRLSEFSVAAVLPPAESTSNAKRRRL